MKVSCLHENLARGLGIVGRAVAARSTLPVLGNVLLATDVSGLRLSATNLELGITCWIGAKVHEEGSTTVPAKTFIDLVGTLPRDRVDLELTMRTQTLQVTSAQFNNDIKCIDAQEFPILPSADKTQAIELNVRDLRAMIDQVVFAAATDDARPVLTGVEVKIEGGEISFAAADGAAAGARPSSEKAFAAAVSSSAAISVSIPAAGAFTSIVTLSVSSSKIGSSALTLSPTAFSQVATVASLRDSPRVGTVISVAMIGFLMPQLLPASGGRLKGCNKSLALPASA